MKLRYFGVFAVGLGVALTAGCGGSEDGAGGSDGTASGGSASGGSASGGSASGGTTQASGGASTGGAYASGGSGSGGSSGSCDPRDPGGLECEDASNCSVECDCGEEGKVTTGLCENGTCASADDMCESACFSGYEGNFCLVAEPGGGSGGTSSGTGGSSASGGSPGTGGSGSLQECCSLFDCSTEVTCSECGTTITGCNIQGNDSCGFCYTENDCEQICADS